MASCYNITSLHQEDGTIMYDVILAPQFYLVSEEMNWHGDGRGQEPQQVFNIPKDHGPIFKRTV